MFFIVVLILFGVLFLVAEIVLLPGISIGGILALVCYGSAGYLAFRDYGTGMGMIVIAVIIVLSIIAAVISLRAKTWQRFSLKQKIESSSMDTPEQDNVKIGDRGVAISRLSPMGKVEIAGKTYEAKSVDVYIDQKSEVEVVGFVNFNVVVKMINKT